MLNGPLFGRREAWHACLEATGRRGGNLPCTRPQPNIERHLYKTIMHTHRKQLTNINSHAGEKYGGERGRRGEGSKRVMLGTGRMRERRVNWDRKKVTGVWIALRPVRPRPDQYFSQVFTASYNVKIIIIIRSNLFLLPPGLGG